MLNFKCTNLLISLLAVISTVSSNGTFQEEVFDYISALTGSNTNYISSQYFKMLKFKDFKIHSKFLVFEPMDNDQWEEPTATELRTLITSGGNTQSVVNTIYKQFFNQNLFNLLKSENTYSTPVFTLTNNEAQKLSQVVLIMPEVEMNLEAWIEQNPNLTGFQLLSIYMQMILLVQEFNFTGNNYCNTRLDGFAINKHGELKLYDYSGVSGGKICKARSGLNAVNFIKTSKKPHDVDSYGLSQAFDQMFFTRVMESRDSLVAYKTSKVKALLNNLFTHNLSPEHSWSGYTGHRIIEEFYDDIYNYEVYKKSTGEAIRIREGVCPGGDESWKEYVQQNQTDINNCYNYEKTFEWCQDEFIPEHCADIIDSLEKWESLEFPLPNEQLCEVRENLDTICQLDGAEDNLKDLLIQDEFYAEFCERAANPILCTEDGLNNEDLYNIVCSINSSICTYSSFYQWTRKEEFKAWCQQENKCTENNDMIEWCDRNKLLLQFNQDHNQFHEFCTYESNFEDIITQKIMVVKDYHLMVKEYFRGLMEREFENVIVNQTAMKPKKPLLNRLAGLLPEESNGSNNPFPGILHDQVFSLETRFTALFGIHFMFSFFMERKSALLATSNMNTPNFFRIAKLAKHYKHCNLEALYSTITSAFSKGPAAIDTQEKFRKLIVFFGSHANSNPKELNKVLLMNNLEKCRDNVIGFLFKRKLKFPINPIPSSKERVDTMMDYLRYDLNYLPENERIMI